MPYRQTTQVVNYLRFFFFNDTATTEIYTSVHTLSLHDALPILRAGGGARRGHDAPRRHPRPHPVVVPGELPTERDPLSGPLRRSRRRAPVGDRQRGDQRCYDPRGRVRRLRQGPRPALAPAGAPTPSRKGSRGAAFRRGGTVGQRHPRSALHPGDPGRVREPDALAVSGGPGSPDPVEERR